MLNSISSMRKPSTILWGLLCTLLPAFTFLCRASDAPARRDANPLYVAENWRIQSSAQATAGETVSSAAFNAAGWHAASVPTTVLSALVQDGTYKDIFRGKNLQSVSSEPFAQAWWYRKEFELSNVEAGECAELILEGVNYRANVWLNGQRLGTTNEILGAFRIFNLDVTGRLKSGTNVLAVEVFPPQPGDFTMGFVDWNPKAPDRDMGLFRPVKLHFYHGVALEHVFVTSRIDHSSWSKAELTVRADVINHSDHAVDAVLKGHIGAIGFEEKVSLGAGEQRAVQLTPERHPELKLSKAQLWWPWELGEPHLYTLELSAEANGTVSDATRTRFGVREVTDYLTPEGYRGYKVNGKSILIRGGGWADDLLLREDEANLRAQVAYTKAMNLNTIRLEGIWGCSQRLYDLADENGLLIMAGWSCQWEWKENLGAPTDRKYGGIITEPAMSLATNYLHDQVLWLRNHPAIFVWVLGSDLLPHPKVEKQYDAMLAAIDPTRPTLKSCGSGTSEVSGPSGVKMNGPYDYVTPNYWYADRKNGGAFGFNTETGPGPQPPPLESLQRMFPADHLWPIDQVWSYHCGLNVFAQMDRYLKAFKNRYGEPKNIEEFAFKSQAANYEAIRAMYEAFGANLPHTTGIVQWMLNAAWPKIYWQLYDYYLNPGGAFFGTQKGAAPAAIVYNYADHAVYIVNQTGRSWGACRAAVTVFDANSKKILEQTVTNTPPAYGSLKVLDLANLAPGTPVYFLDLRLKSDAAPAVTADNFYWLSTQPDVLQEEKSEWYYTPNKSFADFSGLNQLPEATVSAKVTFAKAAQGLEAKVVLTNESDRLAFFMEMRLIGAKSQQTLLPVIWDDNYVSLPPRGKKEFHAQILTLPKGEKAELRIQGWNIKCQGSSAASPAF